MPFVVLTAHGDTETLRTAIQLNATDFIEKPFKEADLLRTLNRAIEYGIQLTEFETTLNELFRDSTLAEEEIKNLKKIKRAVMAMRTHHHLYIKKQN